MGSFRDLRVWRASVSFIVDVYRSTSTFPRSECFGLTAQVRRAAVSIAANIAEGHGRMTRGEWLQFLGHARGSLYEAHLEIAFQLDFLSAEHYGALAAKTAALGSGLTGLIRATQARRTAKPDPKPPTDNRQPTTDNQP